MHPSQRRHPSRTDRLPRRRTDRLEDAAAWVLTAAALFVVLAAVFGGVWVHNDAVLRGRVAAQERTPVAAVLLSDGAIPYDGPGLESLHMARYLDAGGAEHDVLVTVVGQPSAGKVVRMWVDGDGRLVPSPPDGLDALVLGVTAAAAIVVVGWAVLVGLWLGVRRRLAVRNAAEWTREWAEVEPRWSRRGC
jgi:hypothetical protein